MADEQLVNGFSKRLNGLIYASNGWRKFLMALEIVGTDYLDFAIGFLNRLTK